MRAFLIVSLFITSSLFAEDQKKAQAVPPVMYEFLGTLYRLQPYMVSPSKFAAKENDAEIKKSLETLESLSKRLNHSQRLSTPGFQMTAQALQQHFSRLSFAFNEGRKDYARRMLNASIDGCASCHAQVPRESPLNWSFRSNELKGNAFEQAEFQFATRHFDEALDNYKKYLKNPEGPSAEFFKEEALKRKLVIYVRIQNNLKDAISNFTEDQKLKSLSDAQKKELKSWNDSISKLISQKDLKPESMSTAELESLASSKLSPILQKKGGRFDAESYVSFLWVSGFLYRFLNSQPSDKASAGLFYWLAICDEAIGESFFFSLAEDYLKECIQRFPKDPMAKKCYAELEANTLFNYTGSSGVHVPTDVKQELDHLKGLMAP